MKYSMMTYTMSRQPSFDIKTMLDLTVELKMDGIDWVTLYGQDPKDLKMMCDDRAIPVVCHTFHAKGFAKPETRHDGLDIFKRSLEDAYALGAPVVMVPTPGGDIERNQLRKNWIASLAEAIPLAADAGIVLTVENFPGAGSPFVTAADFLEAKQAVPGLKLTFDNGNAGSGENEVDSFAQCAADVVHAHVKDWDRSETPKEGYKVMLDGKYYRPALIGEGIINAEDCLGTMKKHGYAGYINIEYEGNKYSAADGIRRALEYLRHLES
jgi:sugar phosphate isomerase/epimerase